MSIKAVERRKSRDRVQRVHIVERPPLVTDGGDDVYIVCPWMEGLAEDSGPWLAALAIHDCNAFIDRDWTLNAPPTLRARCYVGVFALDRLRSTDGLLSLLGKRSVERIINFPSVSFFDSAMAKTLGSLGLDVGAEREFLAKAQAAGFHVALCEREDEVRPREDGLRPDFRLTHRGPPHPFALTIC
ncbi:hypothetical protein [Terrarubrum flagellatum]|uniref:hypothetical protein n=1 Tax=Terrirubrum flagellatum TaxID=2895980 RepID=UPI003145567C